MCSELAFVLTVFLRTQREVGIIPSERLPCVCLASDRDNSRTRASLADARKQEGHEQERAEMIAADLGLEAIFSSSKLWTLGHHDVLDEDLLKIYHTSMGGRETTEDEVLTSIGSSWELMTAHAA